MTKTKHLTICPSHHPSPSLPIPSLSISSILTPFQRHPDHLFHHCYLSLSPITFPSTTMPHTHLEPCDCKMCNLQITPFGLLLKMAHKRCKNFTYQRCKNNSSQASSLLDPHDLTSYHETHSTPCQDMQELHIPQAQEQLLSSLTPDSHTCSNLLSRPPRLHSPREIIQLLGSMLQAVLIDLLRTYLSQARYPPSKTQGPLQI